MSKEATTEVEEVEESAPSGTGSGDQGQPAAGEAESQASPPSNSSPAGEASGTTAPAPVEYTHPLLKGKSPEEIDRLFIAQQAAIREQNEELNRKAGETAAPAPSKATEPEPDYGSDFMSPRFKLLEQRLLDKFTQMVQPLNQEVVQSAGAKLRERLRSSLKHFSTLEPHIDQLVRSRGGDPNNIAEADLTLLYHTAVGIATSQGINLENGSGAAAPAPAGAPAPAPQQQQAAPVNIPQNRPSAAPLPAPPAAGRRNLNEIEKRLAKEYFPTSKDPEGDYIKLQEADLDTVVEPGFSKQNW